MTSNARRQRPHRRRTIGQSRRRYSRPRRSRLNLPRYEFATVVTRTAAS